MKTTKNWLRLFREKFGQFYISIDSLTKAVRIVDIVKGLKIATEDGYIECVASGDIEKHIGTLLEARTEEIADWLSDKEIQFPQNDGSYDEVMECFIRAADAIRTRYSFYQGED